MDNWVALADHLLGKVSSVLAPQYPGWGMGSVCSDKYPLSSSVRWDLETNSRISARSFTSEQHS